MTGNVLVNVFDIFDQSGVEGLEVFAVPLPQGVAVGLLDDQRAPVHF